MTKKERYDYLKSHGLCPTCGKESGNRVYCTRCRELKKELREKRLMLRICPQCGKTRLYEKEKLCSDCLEKSRLSNTRYRENNIELSRERDRARIKARTVERKNQGLCTKCGRRKATFGYSTCPICRIKATEYSHRINRIRAYNERG